MLIKILNFALLVKRHKSLSIVSILISVTNTNEKEYWLGLTKKINNKKMIEIQNDVSNELEMLIRDTLDEGVSKDFF